MTADEIAKEAEFFWFGTNDLTQLTYGFSRDDIGKFLGAYQDKQDPRPRSVRVARCRRRRRAGRDGHEAGPRDEARSRRSASAASTAATRRRSTSSTGSGFDYVSCSPYRVPVARLAAAQAALQQTALRTEARLWRGGALKAMTVQILVYRDGRTFEATQIDPAWLQPDAPELLWVDITEAGEPERRLLLDVFRSARACSRGCPRRGASSQGRIV